MLGDVADVGEVARQHFRGSDGSHLGHPRRQAAAVATPVLDGPGGVVQGVLHLGGADDVLGRLEHLQHVGLGVVGGDVGGLHAPWFPKILYSVETAVHTLKGQTEEREIAFLKFKLLGSKF